MSHPQDGIYLIKNLKTKSFITASSSIVDGETVFMAVNPSSVSRYKVTSKFTKSCGEYKLYAAYFILDYHKSFAVEQADGGLYTIASLSFSFYLAPEDNPVSASLFAM
jgi:hypothetical protein